MAEDESLYDVLNDLIEALHLQAKEMERIVVRLEQQTGPLHPASQISVFASELSDLRSRIMKLRKNL